MLVHLGEALHLGNSGGEFLRPLLGEYAEIVFVRFGEGTHLASGYNSGRQLFRLHPVEKFRLLIASQLRYRRRPFFLILGIPFLKPGNVLFHQRDEIIHPFLLDLLAPCHRTRYIVRYATLSLLEILGFCQGANSVGKRGDRLCQFVAKYHRQMRFGVWKFLYPVLENGIRRGLAVFKRPLIEFGYQLEDRDGRVKKPLSGLPDVLNADLLQSDIVEHMRLEDYFLGHVMLLFF